MSARVKRVIAAVVVFLCLLAAALLKAGSVCILSGDVAGKKGMDLFYSLKNEPLDMAIVGASSIYTFYKPAQAYDEQKLRTVVISTSAQPGEVIPYIIDEIEDYGNSELVAVELRTVLKEDCRMEECNMEERYFRRAEALLVMRPFSLNRVKGVFEQLSGNDKTPFIEYLFPILQYHDSVYQYTLKDFLNLNRVDFENFFGFDENLSVTDLSGDAVRLKNAPLTGKFHLSDRSKMLIDEIARKVGEHGNQLLFLLTPYAYTSDEYAVACEMKEYMTEKNYNFLNCNDYIEEIGMDFSSDYFDPAHTNVFGAHKFTSWFAKYLREHYDFVNEPSESMQGKWQNLADNWKNTYSEYVDQMREKQSS